MVRTYEIPINAAQAIRMGYIMRSDLHNEFSDKLRPFGEFYKEHGLDTRECKPFDVSPKVDDKSGVATIQITFYTDRDVLKWLPILLKFFTDCFEKWETVRFS